MLRASVVGECCQPRECGVQSGGGGGAPFGTGRARAGGAVRGWSRHPIWDWVSQGGGCRMDQTCSSSSSGLWRRRWQRGDPRESGRRKTPETLGGSWALASCGGPGEDSAGWPSSSRGAGGRTGGLLFLAVPRVWPSPWAIWEDRAANLWLCFPGTLAGRLS